MSGETLLKNGIALIHDANDHVAPTRTDILICNGQIVKLAETISDVYPNTIDCTDKIISPGFIDTHRHGWQTQLKGRHANELLLQYMVTGNAQHSQYSPTAVFYGQLSGALESLSAGTTTVIDHAHINVSASHSKAAIAATASSGIRAVFCYTPMPIAKSFTPLTYHANPLEDWVMQTFDELAAQAPFGNGRVNLGFAWDLWALPAEAVKGVFKKVAESGVRTITTHGAGFYNVVEILKGYGVLDGRVVISHGGNVTQADADSIRQAGAHLSCTPSTELQTAMGRPLCFDAGLPEEASPQKRVGVQDRASLGVDCHSNNAGSIVGEARLGLQTARNYYNEHALKQGKIPRRLPESLSVEAAFNLATIQGARAANLGKEVGRIGEGFKADLVVFDALSPAIIGAAQHDPVAAVISHSSPADIDMVLVDGVVRKKEGRLVDVVLDKSARPFVEEETLAWERIAREVVKSRKEIQRETEKTDVEGSIAAMMAMIQISDDIFAD